MKNLSAYGFNIESPGQKAALLIGLGIVISATVIYFLILPLKERMAAAIKLTDDAVLTNERIRSVINTTNDQEEKVKELQTEYDNLQSKGVLTPLLNSYAMRAKTLVEPYAEQSGLIIENVKELSPIPLQQPYPLNEVAFCRQPIEFTASGSYTQLTAFISYAEKDLPMCILSSLQITSQQHLPEIHKIQISFEWPTKVDLSAQPN